MNELLTMLDTKYKRLEYIQSTGTQYIDTGILANDETGMQVDVQWLNNSDTVCIGSRGASTATRCFIGSATTGFYLGWNELGSSRPAHNLNRNVLSLNFYNNRKKIFNGTDLSDTLQTLSTQTGNMYLFVANDNGSASLKSSVKMYSAQITQGSTLVRNFVPVLRKSDNEIGMLDLVEGKFYPNAGTGKFTANLDTMYALIQGNPTVQDGRVSGFSNSNYLKINNVDNISTSNSWEICLKVNGTGYIIGTDKRYGITLTGRYLYLSSNGSSWDIASAVTTGNIPTSNSYRRLKFTGTQYIYDYSTDGKNWINCATVSNPTKITNITSLLLGFWYSTYYFTGTIDLNRSYIKIDDTKYKLQAVVGYTVVGSPTITDGVVSGFTTSNYLKTTSNYSTADMNSNNYEFVVKFTPFSTMSNVEEAYAIKYFRNTIVRGLGVNLGKLSWCVGYPVTSGHQVRIESSFNITANTTYWLKGVFQNNIAKLYYSLDGQNYDLIGAIDESAQSFTITNAFHIGACDVNYGIFNGSIDLNNTYIKIDNKLWFNGLEQ